MRVNYCVGEKKKTKSRKSLNSSEVKAKVEVKTDDSSSLKTGHDSSLDTSNIADSHNATQDDLGSVIEKVSLTSGKSVGSFRDDDAESNDADNDDSGAEENRTKNDKKLISKRKIKTQNLKVKMKFKGKKKDDSAKEKLKGKEKEAQKTVMAKKEEHAKMKTVLDRTQARAKNCEKGRSGKPSLVENNEPDVDAHNSSEISSDYLADIPATSNTNKDLNSSRDVVCKKVMSQKRKRKRRLFSKDVRNNEVTSDEESCDDGPTRKQERKQGARKRKSIQEIIDFLADDSDLNAKQRKNMKRSDEAVDMSESVQDILDEESDLNAKRRKNTKRIVKEVDMLESVQEIDTECEITVLGDDSITVLSDDDDNGGDVEFDTTCKVKTVSGNFSMRRNQSSNNRKFLNGKLKERLPNFTSSRNRNQNANVDIVLDSDVELRADDARSTNSLTKSSVDQNDDNQVVLNSTVDETLDSDVFESVSKHQNGPLSSAKTSSEYI